MIGRRGFLAALGLAPLLTRLRPQPTTRGFSAEALAEPAAEDALATINEVQRLNAGDVLIAPGPMRLVMTAGATIRRGDFVGAGVDGRLYPNAGILLGFAEVDAEEDERTQVALG